MKHYYLVTLYGYDEEENLYFPTVFVKCNQQLITKADLIACIEDGKKHGELQLHTIAYMGHMTEDAFEHLRSAA